jgi:putative transposase
MREMRGAHVGGAKVKSAKWKLYPREWQRQKLEDIRFQLAQLYNELITAGEIWRERQSGTWIMTEHRGPVKFDVTWPSFFCRLAQKRGYQSGSIAATNCSKRAAQAWSSYFSERKKWHKMGQKRKAEKWEKLSPKARERRQKRGINDARPLPPRRQRAKNYPGWGYDKKTGWKIQLSEREDGGGYHRLYLQGVSKKDDPSTWIRMRGGAAKFGEFRNLIITKDKCGQWWACAGMRVDDDRQHGNKAIAFDWGTSKYLTLHTGEHVENPRHAPKYQEQKAALQRRLARKQKGSRNWHKVLRKLQRLDRKIQDIRRNFVHQVSCDLVKRASVLCTEKLQVRNMTATAKGSEKMPGKNVKQKAGLNRSILDSAPGLLLQMCRAKCKEAGIEFVEVDTRKIKPTQTCASCGAQQKMGLGDRKYRCSHCGWECDRDRNAAMVILAAATGLRDVG